MIVRDWMSTKLTTIGKGASIQEALSLMKKGGIRHLPVVDAEGALTGWVTDADLRGVLIASMLEELTLEDVMIRKPFAAHPDMALDDTVRLILEKRIRGLPVVENGKLVGVITVVDILYAFLTMMGLLVDSSRLDIQVPLAGKTLEDVTRLIHQHRAEVISICHVPAVKGDKNLFTIRLKRCDLKPIMEDLEQHGFYVISSIN